MAGRYRDDYFRERDDARVEVVSHRSRSRASSPISRMLREDRSPVIGGQMVLRQREVETGVRHRSPSPVSVRSERRIVRPRSTSPVERVVIRDRSRSRGPVERIRLVERERSPESSIDRVRVVERSSSRSRRRSPSPDTYHARVLEREREIELERNRESRRASSLDRASEREVIRGPVIEREVVTHWTDVDHGVVRMPSPPPLRRSTLTKETDIDIYHDHHHTDIDISHSHSRSRARSRSRSRSRVRRLSHERLPPVHYHDDTEIVRDRLRIEDREGRYRSHSAAPLRSPSPSYSEEADYITSRIDARGRVGEAYHGSTKDWTIVDVPPGTERVRMDGSGGGSAEVTWQRYNGVRRSKFIPGGEERDTYDRSARDSGRDLVLVDSPTSDSKMSVQIYNREKDREIEIESSRRKTRTSTDMWTEITKDLVCKEALDEAGYEYEETEWFFYVMQYLRYEDVLDLVTRSDRIRRARRRAHEIEYDRDYREYREYHDHRDRHYHRDRKSSHSHRLHVGGGTRHRHYDLDVDYEREKDRDVIYDRRY